MFIDFSFVSGVLTSVIVKTRGSGYAQGSQIDIAVPKTMKARENIAWPSSDPRLDQSNAISDAVYGLPELQNAEQEGKFIEIDTATEYGKTPIDYNYEEIGIASWYGPGFHGKKTANGEIFNQKFPMIMMLYS